MRTFKDLEVWQKSVVFATDIYVITKIFPKEEMYGLVSQMRRAGVSISSNIAEGSKKSKKEFANFIRISQGSSAELETQITIARNLGYISETELSRLIEGLEDIMKMLTKLYVSLCD